MRKREEKDTHASRVSLKNYILAFCIPVLLVGLLLLWDEVWYVHQNAESMHTATLQQVVESIDMIKEHCNNIAANAQAQPGLVDALQEGGQTRTDFISRWIRAYQDMSEFSVYIAMYQRGTQDVYLADGLKPYGEFEDTLDALSASLAGLYGQMNKVTTSQAVTLYRVKDAPYCIAYLYSLMDDSAEIVGTLCVIVPSSAIKEIFYRFFNAKTAALTVLDAACKPLFVEPRQWGSLKALRGLQGTGVTRLDDGQTVVLRVVSARSQQSYCICMAPSDFYRWGSSQVLIYPMIALCVFTALLLAMIIFRSHQRHLNVMGRQNDDLSNKLDKHAQIIRDLVLRKLVDGSINEEDVIQYNLRCANLSLDKPVFFLAVLAFADECDMENVQKLAADICQEMATEDIAYYCFTRFEYSQLILLANVEREACQAEVIKAVRRLVNLPGMACMGAGVGRARHSLQKLSHVLVEALVAINEKLNAHDGPIYIFEPAETGRDYYSQFAIEKSLIRQSLRNGNQAMLQTSVKKVFSDLACSDQSDYVLRCIYYDIVNFCIALGVEFDSPLPDETIAELSSFQTVSTLEKQVTEIMQRLCVHAKEQMLVRLNAPKHNLLNYVQAHFRDSDLSLAMISDELNLTQSYISKLFKEETGQTFISYVKELRLHYAKRELAESSRPIKDIIADSGYIDAASFSRTFKAQEGVTPSEYRMRMQAAARELRSDA